MHNLGEGRGRRIGAKGEGSPLDVQRAADTERPPIEHVGIDHGGLDIPVAQEFLYGADVISVLQEVSGE